MTEQSPIRIPETSGRFRRCILISTCVGFGVEYLLRLSDEFNRHYRLKSFITQTHHKYMADFNITDEEVESCDLLLHLTPGWADWGNEDAYANLLQRFPASTQKISFPYPMLNTLWPLHCADPREHDPDRPKNVHGVQPYYGYGDSFVLAMIREGRPKQEIIDAYLKYDIPANVDVPSLHIWCMNWQMEKEQQTDVKVLAFINDNLQRIRTFCSINHVGNATLIHMADQILGMLGYKPLGRFAHEALFELITPQQPIHPSIIRALELQFVTPETRYLIDSRRNLTFAEYLDQYIDFA